MKMLKKKITFYFLILVIFLANTPFLFAKGGSQAKEYLPRLLFFYSQDCHACHKTRAEVMPAIERESFDKIIIEYLDIADVNNYKLMLSLKEKYKSYEEGVPTVFIEGKILVGYDQVKDGLKAAIQDALGRGVRENLDKLPGINLVRRFLSFGALAIIIAGLIDGINPCAFTVIVFFISFLVFQGYKKKELIIIGLSFILAVFLAYVAIGLGIFRFLYALRHFYAVTKIVYYLIAIFSFALGAFALYDLWIFRKTGDTEGLILQLPRVIKNRIHSIVGLYYRKGQEEKLGGAGQRRLFVLIASAFITGFLVSLLEAVCTGQLYLPTITFVLRDASLRLRALAYLLLYNLMFIIPLFLVFFFALAGVTSETFSRFLKKHMLAVKLLMAIVFFGLGIFILIGA
ncbi:MAG: hypothetical protein FJZ13_03375 [Candidatus Omnitrophica bacterium]|nr:hypothetical protein [Candidatus Omnitrophota bacterium]